MEHDEYTVINHSLDFKTLETIKGYRNSPSWNLMGVRCTEVWPSRSRLIMTVKPEFINALGFCHGGIVAFLADTAMGVAMRTTGPIGVTMDININYIRSAPLGTTLIAEGEVLHRGRRSCICESKIYLAETGKLCATSRGTFLFMEDGPKERSFEAKEETK